MGRAAFSTTTTSAPASAAERAALMPATPAPTTKTSASMVWAMADSLTGAGACRKEGVESPSRSSAATAIPAEAREAAARAVEAVTN